MSQQQYHYQVMRELEILQIKDKLAEKVRQAYIQGWEQGMKDHEDMIKRLKETK